jgi:Choline dehydrogenase and related flavoproteins
MLIDLRSREGHSRFDAPICVLGAGIAGLTVTRRLLSLGWPVLLVESGGADFEAPVQKLSAGRDVGHPYYDLDSVNLRMLGGTTAIWGGRCAELDPRDFQTRSWVPHSGWPIAHADLQPYCREALGIFEVNAPEQARDALRARLPVLADLERDEGLAVGFWSFDAAADRFAAPRIGDVLHHPNCQVLIHATATHIALAADGNSVASVTVKDVSGKSATIRAGHVVVALGGIETPRLLLASNDVAPAGIGNGHDLVGRFFMEHPHARGGGVTGPGVWELLRVLSRRYRVNGTRHAALLRLSDAAQERLGTLNTALTLGARQPEAARQALMMKAYADFKHNLDATTLNRRLWRAAKAAVVELNDLTVPLRPWLSIKSGRAELAAIVRAEQAPNPDSRIRLDGSADALGMPRAALDWRLCRQDKHSVACLMDSLDSTLRRLGLGKAHKAGWLEDPDTLWRTDVNISAHPIGGYHHMGTTRMADDPSRGVVDANGRVHGIANLHIAGSSVFPTGGWANPTLTIAALALRLGDRFGRFTG